MAARRVLPATGRIWRADEIADRWQTSIDTVEKMCRTGVIRGAFKAGRQWRLSEEALVAHERGVNPFASVPLASVRPGPVQQQQVAS